LTADRSARKRFVFALFLLLSVRIGSQLLVGMPFSYLLFTFASVQRVADASWGRQRLDVQLFITMYKELVAPVLLPFDSGGCTNLHFRKENDMAFLLVKVGTFAF